MPQPTTNNLEGWGEELDSFDSICPVCKSGIKQFISDLRKHDMEELIKMLPEKIDHDDSCECLEDVNMPCDCGTNHHNYLISKTEDLIKQYYAK